MHPANASREFDGMASTIKLGFAFLSKTHTEAELLDRLPPKSKHMGGTRLRRGLVLAIFAYPCLVDLDQRRDEDSSAGLRAKRCSIAGVEC